jgi:hypothetical protein
MFIPAKQAKMHLADEDEYITEESGPWLIMAATFSGDGAEEQARDLVKELRQRYKLKAYLHEMSFDFSQGEVGLGVDSKGDRRRMKYRRGETIHEIAVLVGDYPTIDDSVAQKTLKRVKTLKPRALSPDHREETNQSLAALRTVQRALLPEGHASKSKGPMGKAFMTRNPLLPREYFVPDGVDEIVLEMNRDVPHSLLDCKGKYTVKIATFTGTVVIDQRKVREYQERGNMPSSLEKAEYKAHQLTEALRKKGYEAYEFHDRYASMVTVGSFNSVGTPRADGKTEINPQIHAIMKTFGGTPLEAGAGGHPAGFKPKTLSGIPFDIQPQIVHVPKRPISRTAWR